MDEDEYVGRESLRYTDEIPFLEQMFTMSSSLTNSGGRRSSLTVSRQSDLEDTISALLEIAVEKGQTDRIEKLLGFQAQLNRVTDALRHSYPGRQITAADIVICRPPIPQAPPLPAPSSSSSPGSSSPSSSPAPDLPKFLQCLICLEDVLDDEAATVCSQHFYCPTCFSTYLSTAVNDNQVESLKCPDPDCQVEVQETHVLRFAPREDYEKYLRFTLLAFLKTDSNFIWCPNPRCGAVMEKDDDFDSCGLIECTNCAAVFCIHCGQSHPSSVSCETAAAHQEDEAFLAWLAQQQSLVKPCPHCTAKVQKNEGCNHITCIHCRGEFCWICGKPYEYGHFQNGVCDGLQFVAANDLAEVEAFRENQRLEQEREAERQALLRIAEANLEAQEYHRRIAQREQLEEQERRRRQLEVEREMAALALRAEAARNMQAEDPVLARVRAAQAQREAERRELQERAFARRLADMNAANQPIPATSSIPSSQPSSSTFEPSSSSTSEPSASTPPVSHTESSTSTDVSTANPALRISRPLQTGDTQRVRKWPAVKVTIFRR